MRITFSAFVNTLIFVKINIIAHFINYFTCSIAFKIFSMFLPVFTKKLKRPDCNGKKSHLFIVFSVILMYNEEYTVKTGADRNASYGNKDKGVLIDCRKSMKSELNERHRYVGAGNMYSFTKSN